MINKLINFYMITSSTLFFITITFFIITLLYIKKTINIIFCKEVFDLEFSHIYFQIAASLYIKCLGIDIRINNLDSKFPKEKTSIYLYTHTNFLENFVIYSQLPVLPRSIAKIELFSFPIIKDFMKVIGAIPIDRNNIKNAINSLNLVEKKIKNGGYISIAPEGTRRKAKSTGKGEVLLPFKKGAFKMAKNIKTSIIPLVFYGSGRVLPANSFIPNPRTTIYLDIGPEYLSTEIDKYDDNQIREKIEKEIKDKYRNIPDSKVFNGGLGIKYNLSVTLLIILVIYCLKLII